MAMPLIDAHEYWPTRDHDDQPILLHEALSLFDRANHLEEIDGALERALQRRSFVVVVQAASEDLPEAFPLRLDAHVSRSRRRARMLGCANWTPKTDLEELLEGLQAKLGSAVTEGSAKPSGSGRETFKKMLSATSGHFFFCQTLEYTRYEAAKKQGKDKPFTEALKNWLKYFAEECDGPAQGAFVAVLIVQLPSRLSRESSVPEPCVELTNLFKEYKNQSSGIIVLDEMGLVQMHEYSDWCDELRRSQAWRAWVRDLLLVRADIFANADARPLREIYAALQQRFASGSRSGGGFVPNARI